MYGVSVFPVTIASAGTLSSEIDLGGRWDNTSLIIPTMASNSQIHFQAATTSGGTYRRVYDKTLGTPADFSVLSGVTSRIVSVPVGFRYVKVETTATMDSGQSFEIICGGA
jgi:hypothetical protein